MSEAKHRAEADALVQEVLKRGTNTARRSLFVSAAAFGAAAALPLAGATPAQAQARRAILKDDSRVLNIGATVRSGKYWNFTTFLTPVEEFYVRNHYPTPVPEQRPVLNPANWRLRIHGESVERPLELTYEQLLALPSRTIIATMEGHGNGRTLFWEQDGLTGEQVSGGNWILGAVGQAEWQYVPMSEIFARVGVKPDARTVLFWSGVDGNDMGRPMPYADVVSLQHDMGICYAMNGNPLPPDHGAPVRVVVPGWGGTASIKWLTEIRVTNKRVWCRLNTRGEVFIGPAYPRPEFSPDDEFIGVTPEDIRGPMVTWMPPKSLITVPLVLERSPSVPPNYPLQRGQWPRLSAGRQVLRGYAWAPQHGVREVHVRVDGGPWQPAQIRPPNLGKYTWVRFEFPWEATPGRHVIETRTTDTTGYMQPETVPMNILGMAHGGIPKFRIEVV
ncbi:MAG: molybdopterin-dependent oxidoreductase [Acetobacteraceae bacterium]|nr:molybdopterin-dependent oxidoreductase [Acetobacteraceae bacterium]